MVLGASGALWDRFFVFGAFNWVMEAGFISASVSRGWIWVQGCIYDRN
jgi:hypothetical protein